MVVWDTDGLPSLLRRWDVSYERWAILFEYLTRRGLSLGESLAAAYWYTASNETAIDASCPSCSQPVITIGKVDLVRLC